jgi:ATP-dependent Clp protease ATP-binding subunit ClpC
MYERFTDRARKVMQLANQEAQRFSHEYIGTEHILLGLVKEGSGVAANVLKNLDIDLRMIRLEVEKIVQAGPDMVTMGKLPHTPRAKKVIEYAIEESRALNHNYVGTEHLLLGLLREQEGVASQVLMNLGLNLEDVREEVLNLLHHNLDASESRGGTATTKRGVPTPALDSVARDLTALARQGKLSALVGRQRELERIQQVLLCRDSANPLLVGEAGVGKTALVEGLAQRMAAGSIPDFSPACRLLALDLEALLVQGKDLRHQHNTLRAVQNELRRAKNMILFLEHFHLLGEPGRDPGRAFQVRLALSAILESGEGRCIAVATPESFRRIIAPDRILERSFRPIVIEPLSAGETLAILCDRREGYAAHHGVQITDGALQAVLEMSDRYLTESYFPRKAIRLLDEACALVRLRTRPAPPNFAELDARLEELSQKKEAAVAAQDFQAAAQLRDQADTLQQERDRLVRQWEEKKPEAAGVVDEEAVAAVLGQAR